MNGEQDFMGPPGDRDEAGPGPAEPRAMGPAQARKPASRRAMPKHQSMAVYVISVAAELAGVHPQTLRIYERKGLLGPARTLGGSRRYSDMDIELLRRIQQLTAAGLNLEGVKRVIELEAEVDRLRHEVAEARAEARSAVEQVHRHYRRDLVPLDMSPVRWFPPR
jgi:MerR family transcriptional regulator/heat shock protein HspR